VLVLTVQHKSLPILIYFYKECVTPHFSVSLSLSLSRMKIIIKTLKDESFELDVEPTDTVKALKLLYFIHSLNSAHYFDIE
jgi:hypothetical protein